VCNRHHVCARYCISLAAKGRIRTFTTEVIRYKVVFATVGARHSQQRLSRPLVLDDIASSKDARGTG